MNSTPSWLLIFVLLVGALAFGAPVRADAPQVWQRSYELEARGEHAASLAALNELPEEAKTGYLFLVRRAWLLYLTARYQEAVGAYRQAIEAAPKAVEPREGILAPLIALHRFQDAEAEARAALRLDKDNHAVSRSLAWALYEPRSLRRRRASLPTGPRAASLRPHDAGRRGLVSAATRSTRGSRSRVSKGAARRSRERVGTDRAGDGDRSPLRGRPLLSTPMERCAPSSRPALGPGSQIRTSPGIQAPPGSHSRTAPPPSARKAADTEAPLGQ